MLTLTGCRLNAEVPPEAPPAPTEPPTNSQPDNAPSGPIELRFAWETPCTVEARAKLSGSEESAEYRQLLVMRPRDDGNFVLSGAGIELTRYRGLDPQDPAVQHGVARFLATYSLPVELVIDRAGGLVEVHGLDADSLLGVVRKLMPVSPEAEEMVRILFKRPDVQEYFLYVARREWSSGGETWHGIRLARGEERVIEDTVELAGKTLPRRTTMLHAGPVDGEPGYVRLMFERIVETTRDQVRAGGTLFGLEFGRPPLGDRGALIPMQSMEQAEVVTDPRTLRPRRVVYEWSRRTDGERTWYFRIERDFRWPERCDGPK